MSRFICTQKEGVTVATFGHPTLVYQDSVDFVAVATTAPGDLVLDLLKVTQVEGGFGPVLQAFKVLRQRRLLLALALPPDLLDLWQLLKLHQVIPAFLCVEDAVQRLALEADQPLIVESG